MYLLESPRRGDSNKYPKRMFSKRTTWDCLWKNTRSADFCRYRIDIITNFAVITNVVIKMVRCTCIWKDGSNVNGTVDPYCLKGSEFTFTGSNFPVFIFASLSMESTPVCSHRSNFFPFRAIFLVLAHLPYTQIFNTRYPEHARSTLGIMLQVR